MIKLEFTKEELTLLRSVATTEEAVYNYGCKNIELASKYRGLINKITEALDLPLTLEFDKSPKNIAKLLMQAIQYDNGWVDRDHEESYPAKWLELIKQACEVFFVKNPQFVNEGDIENIATGEYKENEDEFSQYEGWAELDRVLGHYFDHYPEEDKPQGVWIETVNDWADCKKCQVCGTIKYPGEVLVCECDKKELVK